MRTLTIMLLMCCSLSCLAEFAVVVPTGSSIDILSEEEIASIFLGKTNRFPNGERAVPMEIQDRALRTLFYEIVSGKSLNQLNSYWATLVFTGKGRPPRVLSDMNEIVRQLPHSPGAITYVPTDQVTGEMKVVYSVP